MAGDNGLTEGSAIRRRDFLKRHVLGMRGADTVHHEQYISQRTQQAAAFSLTERRMFATVYKLSAPKRLREKVPQTHFRGELGPIQ